jgi:hypothetical protein
MFDEVRLGSSQGFHARRPIFSNFPSGKPKGLG